MAEEQPKGVDLQAWLRQLLLKENFSEDELKQVAGLSKQVDYPPGSVILREGQENEILHLLLSGSVDVLRAGEKIASLSTPGDVLGEMSLVTKKPCAATIRAGSPVMLLSIDLGKIGQLSQMLQERFLSATHRLFSLILARKLAATNEKARLFEITNRELQKTQMALEAASTSRITDLAEDRQNLLKRLETLYQNEVVPLLKADPASLRNGIESLARQMESLRSVGSAAASVAATRVLFAEVEINEQIHAKMSLGGTGAQSKIVGSPEECSQALASESWDIICLGKEFLSLLPEAQKHNPKARLAFVTSDPINEHVQILQSHKELSTIVARHPEDRQFSVRNLATTIRKLAGGDLFGLDKYLSWGTEVREHTITGSAERAQITESLGKYLDEIGTSPALQRRCSGVAEELLMNAIYDAPTDASGKSIYNHLDRLVPISLAPKEQGKFRYGCDGNLIAVSVEDPFGALTRSVILNYLDRCLSGKIGEEIADKGGGGNGLFQIIRQSSLVVFNVKPKVRTEVIALFSTGIQFEKIRPQPSFHFFEA
jgi:CRP-like cAMP-binding protein